MSKRIETEKLSVAANDMFIIKDSEDSDRLKEVSASLLGITATVLAALEDYNPASTYNIDDTVKNGDFMYRSLTNGNTGNTPPTVSSPGSTNWEMVGFTFPQHDPTGDTGNVPVQYGGKILIPHGDVVVATPVVGFGVGQYMDVMAFNQFFDATIGYPPGSEIIHTNGLRYTKWGTTSTPNAWSEGFSDGRWMPSHANHIGMGANIAFTGPDSSPVTQLIMSDHGMTIQQSPYFGIFQGTNGLEFTVKGQYRVTLAWALQDVSTTSTWTSSSLTAGIGCNVTMSGVGMSHANHNNGDEGQLSVAVYDVDVFADVAGFKPRINGSGGLFSVNVDRCWMTVDRIY